MPRSSATSLANRRQRRRARRGVALIETIVALVVLAFTGAGMIALLAQTLSAVKNLHTREREMTDAARSLERLSALNRAELLALAGVQRLPTIWLEIDPRADSLFNVVARDTLYRAELLHTTLYRPDSLP